jgi:peptidyl-tRNA hydrolase, PTH2 family
MSDNSVKMVIVMRTKFPDGNGGTFSPRKGKMIAQGAHAASAFLIKKLQQDYHWRPLEIEWLRTGTTKICVQVESEEELLDIHNKAEDAKLPVHLITDAGRTEFKEPTTTCLALGPARSEDVDKITGRLKLL